MSEQGYVEHSSRGLPPSSGSREIQDRKSRDVLMKWIGQVLPCSPLSPKANTNCSVWKAISYLIEND